MFSHAEDNLESLRKSNDDETISISCFLLSVFGCIEVEKYDFLRRRTSRK